MLIARCKKAILLCCILPRIRVPAGKAFYKEMSTYVPVLEKRGLTDRILVPSDKPRCQIIDIACTIHVT